MRRLRFLAFAVDSASCSACWIAWGMIALSPCHSLSSTRRVDAISDSARYVFHRVSLISSRSKVEGRPYCSFPQILSRPRLASSTALRGAFDWRMSQFHGSRGDRYGACEIGSDRRSVFAKGAMMKYRRSLKAICDLSPDRTAVSYVELRAKVGCR